MARIILLGGGLALWLVALLFLSLCASDIIFFHPGRERWFALALNGTFLALIVFLLLGAKADIRRYPKSIGAISAFFTAALILSGDWVPLVASVSGPPWEDRINGMPASAVTPFMNSVWAWSVGDISSLQHQ